MRPTRNAGGPMALPLRKTIYMTALATALVLASLLALGARQYQLNGRHALVTQQTEKIIFQFAIIREHVTEALLEGRYARLSGVADELEELNGNLTAVLSERMIGDQYRISFLNSIDLPGIILLVRKIESGPVEQENLRQLNREIRTLGERLMLFDRVLVNDAKRRLISFQNIVIGALALIVTAIIVILILFHKKLLAPLFDLIHQVKEVAAGRRKQLSIGSTIGELSELAYSFHDILVAGESSSQGLARYQRVAGVVKRTQQAIARSRSRAMLYRDVCRALLANPEYCLIWIGSVNAQGTDVLPESADGSTSMSKKECDACLAVLLTEAEDKGLASNPAAQALQGRKGVVLTDILAEVPRGLLKNTPLAEGHASCAALPLIWQDEIYGVLSIYASTRDGFDAKELELLEGLAGDIAIVLYSLAEGDRLREAEGLNRDILDAVSAGRIDVNPQGVIVAADAGFLARIGKEQEEILGHDWLEFLQPDSAESGADLQAACGREIECSLKGGKDDRRMLCRVFSRGGQEGMDARYTVICRTLPTVQVHQAGQEGAQAGLSHLEILGELSAGVAHEINDLSNGVINYAQVLADETQAREPHGQQNPMFQKIIATGERIAEIVRKLIFYSPKQDEAGEFLPVATVLDDAILLAGYQLKTDGIKLELASDAAIPVVPVQAQQMQQVFLALFMKIRHALEKKLPGKDGRKRLAIELRGINANHERELHIVLTDYGAGLAAQELAREAAAADSAPTGWFGRCCRVVATHGGTVTVSGENEDLTRIVLRFPVGGE